MNLKGMMNSQLRQYISNLKHLEKQIGQIENVDVSDIADIADFFSPTFKNPCFRYSPIVNVENLDFKNPIDFQTSAY